MSLVELDEENEAPKRFLGFFRVRGASPAESKEPAGQGQSESATDPTMVPPTMEHSTQIDPVTGQQQPDLGRTGLPIGDGLAPIPASPPGVPAQQMPAQLQHQQQTAPQLVQQPGAPGLPGSYPQGGIAPGGPPQGMAPGGLPQGGPHPGVNPAVGQPQMSPQGQAPMGQAPRQMIAQHHMQPTGQVHPTQAQPGQVHPGQPHPAQGQVHAAQGQMHPAQGQPAQAQPAQAHPAQAHPGPQMQQMPVQAHQGPPPAMPPMRPQGLQRVPIQGPNGSVVTAPGAMASGADARSQAEAAASAIAATTAVMTEPAANPATAPGSAPQYEHTTYPQARAPQGPATPGQAIPAQTVQSQPAQGAPTMTGLPVWDAGMVAQQQATPPVARATETSPSHPDGDLDAGPDGSHGGSIASMALLDGLMQEHVDTGQHSDGGFDGDTTGSDGAAHGDDGASFIPEDLLLQDPIMGNSAPAGPDHQEALAPEPLVSEPAPAESMIAQPAVLEAEPDGLTDGFTVPEVASGAANLAPVDPSPGPMQADHIAHEETTLPAVGTLDFLSVEVDLQPIERSIRRNDPVRSIMPGGPERYLPFVARALAIVARKFPELLTPTAADRLDCLIKVVDDQVPATYPLVDIANRRLASIAEEVGLRNSEAANDNGHGCPVLIAAVHRPGPSLGFVSTSGAHKVALTVTGVDHRPVGTVDRLGCSAMSVHAMGVIGAAFAPGVSAGRREAVVDELKRVLENRDWDTELD